MINLRVYLGIFLLAMATAIYAESELKQHTQGIEQLLVWGKSISSHEAAYVSPTSILLPKDMQSINAVTTEDLVKYEPSLVIRRRFIGDSNGTLGMRGSNMFQTSRSMVFADGVPIHYLLQSRWNGAPRWTMVSASEIDKVEVIYGPFSAEYSGNSMGGVVLVETGIPQKREFHANLSVFAQEFDDYGFDDTVSGYKGFLSYGDKVGDFSYYLSYNRLDNDSQPQTFRGASSESSGQSDNVTGAVIGLDARLRDDDGDGVPESSRTLAFYGDTGVVKTLTDNYKFKLGYDFGRWQTLLNLAFEDRSSENLGQSYIRDANGQSVWSGSELIANGREFSFNSRRINESALERESLSIGLRLKGELSDSARIEANINQFDIIKDDRITSTLNPQDPSFDNTGQLTEFNNSGWQTAELKLTLDNLAIDGLEWVSGIRHENYELNLDVIGLSDYQGNTRADFTSRFGGKTSINAVFSQFNLRISDAVSLALGLRHERFKSHDGYYSQDDNNTPQLDLVLIPEEKQSKTSPKFSAGYQFSDTWLARYSIAKAYRFPIVEELFRQYQAFNSINEANPELAPEDGLHQNFMLEKTLDNGYMRINLFYDIVENTIESQSTTIIGGANDGVSLSTFVPLDKTRATGAEFVLNQYDAFIKNLDVRFNLTYTDAKIIKNASNPEWEGNRYPRMPKWRGNLLATYHLSERWNLGTNVQYASDSFGRIQNDDTIDNVYGAQDAFTRIGLKTNYKINKNLTASVGIDNISNDVAYVAHPWPGRTYYLNLAYKNL